MLNQLKKLVCEANLDLVAKGLVIDTFGNVSGVDRASGCMVIKPSGASYGRLRPAQMVVVSLKTGKVVEGRLRPSSDTPTHLELYRAFPAIGGVAHTHSTFATAWAQARMDIPALGTTHADSFHGPVPCTRLMRPSEIKGQYELNTGKVIVERFARLDPASVPAVLVAAHGPFSWGATPGAAVHNAFILEHLAKLAFLTRQIAPTIKPMPRELLDKHFLRKHGPGAYYGQERSGEKA
ncbi:MAG: L-ribulose-5-phosphate 4-epimerase [Phycisphaerae bacterium]